MVTLAFFHSDIYLQAKDPEVTFYSSSIKPMQVQDLDTLFDPRQNRPISHVPAVEPAPERVQVRLPPHLRRLETINFLPKPNLSCAFSIF